MEALIRQCLADESAEVARGSTDQQQAWRISGLGQRSAMHTRRDGAVRVVSGKAPKIEKAEGKRLSFRSWCVMQVVAMLGQKLAKAEPLPSTEGREQSLPRFREIDSFTRILVAEALARWTVVGAKICLSFEGRAIGVKRKHICRHRAGVLIAGVAIDAV